MMRAQGDVAMRTSLGLGGDLDDVELVQDIEQAFGIQLPDGELSRCETVGDLFDLVVRRLPEEFGTGDRCASAMCFYRLRRAVMTIAPNVELRPSTSIEALRHVPVRSLYRALKTVDGMRPPVPNLSLWGCLSLFLAVAAPIGLLIWGAPGWTAFLGFLVAIGLFRLSPVCLPPRLRTFGDLVELVTARSIGMLAAHGARLRPAEAWKAMKVVCTDHAVTNEGEIGRGTFILAQPKASR